MDDNDQVVKRKLAYAGNNFKEEEIKSLPLENINDAMKNRYGMGRKNVNIAPGTNIPFTIVFENLPKNSSEFTVEAVSSSPADFETRSKYLIERRKQMKATCKRVKGHAVK